MHSRKPAFLSPRWLIGLFVILSNLLPFHAGADGKSPVAVVEMFTSQGCSSCPPADELLSKYAQDDKVLALSWHVDYWNYLGWKDTFSHEKFTLRQQRYAKTFRRRGVYTPQAVINGRTHTVGSRKADIDAMIETYRDSGKGMTVDIDVDIADGRVHLTADSAHAGATLMIIYYDLEKTVRIKRGENTGRTMTYHNVVRDVATVGMLKDGKLDVTLPLAELRRQGADACAVVLQQSTPDGGPGAIIGAKVIYSGSS